MDPAKIRLSAEEQALVENAEWILTKNGILNKVNLLLVEVQEQQELIVRAACDNLPLEICNSTAKISRGENYLGLPYLILDYPRSFGKEDTVAVRTMFWWGNFFSVTLHLSGSVKRGMEEKLSSAYGDFSREAVYVNINEDQWEHHFESNNYVAVSEMTAAAFQTAITNRNFLKLAQRISLDEWNTASQKLTAMFRKFIMLMGRE